MLPDTHPEWARLLEKRAALLSQLATTIAELQELDDLRPVVLGRYSAAFGAQLTQLASLDLDAARLKREIDLIQSYLNRGAEVNYAEILQTLEDEFKEWQARVDALAKDLASQRSTLYNLLDPDTSQEITRLFRLLVKRLHPDLHPDQPTAHIELWHRVMTANEQANLDELTAIELITRDFSDDPSLPSLGSDSGSDALAALLELVENLEQQLDRLLERRAALRATWPFDQLPLLDDPDATAARRAELDDRIATATQLRDERKIWLDRILGR